MQRFLGLLLLVAASVASLMLGCSDQERQVSAPDRMASAAEGAAALAPLLTAAPGAKGVDGAYIVVFEDSVASVDQAVGDAGTKYSFSADYRYRHALKGFAGRLSPSALAALRRDPRVSYIEEDQVAHIVASQSNPTWGLDRIDQRTGPLSSSYVYQKTGAGVDVYIIDTGVRLSHRDFGGRAIKGYDAVLSGGTTNDGHGHGTHVAGTVGGATYGVAKGVRLISVRVLDNRGQGTYAQVIAGIDWVTSNHTTRPAVANMSLGGSLSTALDNAVRRSIADGITYCIAAGNSATNASTESPADVAEAITVGATDQSDTFAWFSNYGDVVDLLAPGVDITSDWYLSNSATATISGTSMASPHAAGVAALYLQAHPGATPAAVAAALVGSTTSNAIGSVPGGTANRLLYSLFGALPPPLPTPAAPALQSPADNATNVNRPTTLSWSLSPGATSYRVQVSTSASFTTLAYDRSGITSSSTVAPTQSRTYHYWRVKASNANGASSWSTAWRFRTR